MPTRADSVRRRWSQVQRSGWTTPVTGVLLGLLALSVQSARGDVDGGLVSLGIMCGFSLVLAVFGGRSETVSLLRGDIVDERSGQIQQRALAATGGVLVLVLVGGFFIELGRGAADVGVWSGLCSLAGLTFGGSLVVLSRRS